MTQHVIEMREITKKFGDFVANDHINLNVRKGEIHALLGENGAGKSTLMNMLAGLLEPTSGEIVINDKSVQIDSPSKSAKLGIGMVHQHFMLVEAFTVAENIILGNEVVKNGCLDLNQASKDIKVLSEKYGLAINPSAKVSDISVGAQQRVEILKTLYRGADILIFDEPTAVLTPAEIKELMTIMKNLVKEGKSIILITHKLDEIRAVADRVTVIRRGKSIETVDVAGATSQDLAEMMVGRSVSFTTSKKAAEPKDVVLSIKNLEVDENRGISAGWFALLNPDMPRPLLILMTALIGMIAGGIAGAIPGILRAYLGTSEVIVTIMMNYIILYVGNAIVQRGYPESVKQSIDSTIQVSDNASYQTHWLSALTNNSRINIGIFFAIIAIALIWFLLNKTTLGFEIRSVGLNPHASEYAGMSSKRTIILSMIISGALAGLGGVVEGLGTFENVFVQGSSLAVGFDGMAVSLLAANSPLGIFFSSFLFGVLNIGAPGMNIAGIPPELVKVVTASIIFFVGSHYLIERYIIRPKKLVKGGK